MTTDDHILEVVQAHKDGKRIDTMSDLHPNWIDCTENPGWDFEHKSFRVAPEPRKAREWWITPFKFDLCHMSEIKTPDAFWHVREIIE